MTGTPARSATSSAARRALFAATVRHSADADADAQIEVNEEVAHIRGGPRRLAGGRPPASPARGRHLQQISEWDSSQLARLVAGEVDARSFHGWSPRPGTS